MPEPAPQPSDLTRLHRIAPGQPIAAFEVREDKLAQCATKRPVTPGEVRELIERLLQQLPEPERQAFYLAIRTDGMI